MTDGMNGMKAFNGSKLQRLIHFRNRAEEVRIIADDFTDAHRKMLLNVAVTYDSLADALRSELSSKRI
jgi:hypothetical protein